MEVVGIYLKHETHSQLCSIFRRYADINFEMVAPKDNITKTKADYFKRLTGWTKRTSEHSRDAGMLVFGWMLKTTDKKFYTPNEVEKCL